MDQGLFLDTFPEYHFSAFKVFAPGERHITRTCPEDVLLLMLEGMLHFHEEGQAVTLAPGEYYIQRHGLRQEGLLPSDHARYYYIHFTGHFSAAGSTLPLRGKMDISDILPLCTQLDSLRMLYRPMVEKSAVFYLILSSLNRSRTDSRYCRIVDQVVSAVSRDLQRQYSLDTLADLCGYSKNHIINVFKTQTGRTPCAYIQKLRLDTARQMLAYSDSPVATIALNCGFGSYINFYKAFLKDQGCAPQQWRERRKRLS